MTPSKGQIKDTVRPLLEKQAYPEYDQAELSVACTWHVEPIRVSIVSITTIRLCFSFDGGDLAVYALGFTAEFFSQFSPRLKS